MNKLCSKCKKNERVISNTYCKSCKNEYMRIWNKKKNDSMSKKEKIKFLKKRSEYMKKRWKENDGYQKYLNYKNNRDNGFYKVWLSMTSRCKYKSHSRYKYYGGRGIKCEWNNYQSFKYDMYSSFMEHLKEFGWKQTTIDRIDNEKNYSNKNCKWATLKEQAKNKRPRKCVKDII